MNDNEKTLIAVLSIRQKDEDNKIMECSLYEVDVTSAQALKLSTLVPNEVFCALGLSTRALVESINVATAFVHLQYLTGKEAPQMRRKQVFTYEGAYYLFETDIQFDDIAAVKKKAEYTLWKALMIPRFDDRWSRLDFVRTQQTVKHASLAHLIHHLVTDALT